MADEPEPLAAGFHADGQLREVGRQQADLAATRPFEVDHTGEAGQHLHGGQGVFGIVQRRGVFAAGRRGFDQERQRGEDFGHVGQLGVQVALGGHRFAGDGRHQLRARPRRAPAGAPSGPAAHHQPQADAAPHRRHFGAQAGFRLAQAGFARSCRHGSGNGRPARAAVVSSRAWASAGTASPSAIRRAACCCAAEKRITRRRRGPSRSTGPGAAPRLPRARQGAASLPWRGAGRSGGRCGARSGRRRCQPPGPLPGVGAASVTSIGTVGAWDSTTPGCPTSAITAAARSSTWRRLRERSRRMAGATRASHGARVSSSATRASGIGRGLPQPRGP